MRRSLVAAVTAFVLLLSTAPSASAAHRAHAEVTMGATAATWGVVAVAQGAAPTMSPLTLTWVNVKGLRYAFVDLVNVGTVPVGSATLLPDSVPLSGGNSTAPWLYFDACVGADWNAISGGCPGTTVRVGASAGNALTSVVPITTGGRLSIRVLHSSNPNHFRSSLQVSVSQDQIRVSATTNS